MEAIIEGFRQIGIDLEMPQGTFYLWGRVPHGYTSISFADEVLSKYAIVITPGSWVWRIW